MEKSYTSLEPTTLSSLGVAAPSFNGTSASFFATTSFIYSFFFIAIVMAAFYGYTLASVWRMQASPESISKSNEKFKKVTLGLLGSFGLILLILTVNKDLLTGDIGLGELKAGRGADNVYDYGTGKGGVTPVIPKNNDDPTGWSAIQNDASIRSQLAALPNGGITVNKNVCVNPTQTSCTTVGGLPQETISMLASLRSKCGGKIAVTGGTEAGHSSHGPGKNPVDLSLNDGTLESCIRSFPAGPAKNFCKVTYSQFGYTFCDERGVAHWHVFK